MGKFIKATFTWTLSVLAALPLLAAADSDFYRVINLVSNQTGIAPSQDLNLVNPWGFEFSSSGNLFVANNGTSTATTYTPTGGALNFNMGTKAPVRPTLSISVLSNPTGLVINPSDKSFKIGKGSSSSDRKPAELLFSTEHGKILAYNKHINPKNAIVVIDHSSHGAVYKGLEIAKVDSKIYLYATDFHNAKIDVFNSNFKFVKSFTDKTIPAGFAPFNIRNFEGKLYVTYAKQKPPKNHNDEPGLGNGFVDIFEPNGKLIKRLISNGNLNSPWGLAIAPKHFGRFSHALLVGNFGDGFINAYNPKNGNFLGKLKNSTKAPIKIDGLWGLRFQPGVNNPKALRPNLYFTSGPNGESNGLLGLIQFVDRK